MCENNKVFLTRETIASLKPGNKVYYQENGKVIPWTVNGKLKVWKRTGNFKLPIKFGLYHYGYIDEQNLTLFYILESGS